MPCSTPEKQRQYQNEWKLDRRTTILAGKVCACCGKHDDLVAHHIIPRSISGKQKISWSCAVDKILKELEECEILCRNCHIEHHAMLLRKEIVHGTLHAYDRGCRCDDCKRANRDYKGEYRARTKKIYICPFKHHYSNTN